MHLKRIFGILGLSLPVLALASFVIFFQYFKPNIPFEIDNPAFVLLGINFEELKAKIGFESFVMG